MTTRYMLDTDSVSYALRGEGGVEQRILQHPRSAVCCSVITEAELRYGADKVQSQRLHAAIDTFLASVTPIPFDPPQARRFGQLLALLQRQGIPIGQFDTMIAAAASTLGLTLVTHNTRHFSRVEGLTLEDWF